MSNPARALGHFTCSVNTGAIAAGMAANGEVFQFYWTNTTRLAVISEITITGMRATTAFAAGTIDISAAIARTWTAAGSGGTDIEMGSGDSHTTDNGQMRSSQADSLVADLRVATTAALTAGTRTLNTTDLGLITTHSSGGVGSATPIIGSIYLPTTSLFKADLQNGQYPLVLAADQGFVIRATVPATGVWNLGIRVKWSEVPKDQF